MLGETPAAGIATNIRADGHTTTAFPHDKHQNEIASLRHRRTANQDGGSSRSTFVKPAPVESQAPNNNDKKASTYRTKVTITAEFAQLEKTGSCTYCHTAESGKKKPPASHDAVAPSRKE